MRSLRERHAWQRRWTNRTDNASWMLLSVSNAAAVLVAAVVTADVATATVSVAVAGVHAVSIASTFQIRAHCWTCKGFWRAFAVAAPLLSLFLAVPVI
jgi:hypothetical protein